MSTNSFYVTGGTLRLDAPSYVERQADRDLFESLLQGEFCYVLTARQMGKSSLMVRTANKLRSQGAHVIALDLSAVGQNLTPGQWYNGLLTSMGAFSAPFSSAIYLRAQPSQMARCRWTNVTPRR